MSTVVLILQAIVAALKFPSELAALIRLLEKSPEEKRQEIMIQVDAWMRDSATGDKPGEEVPEPKWEK